MSLLEPFRASNPKIPFIIDTDSTVDTNPFDQAVEEGLKYDQSTGSHGWEGLQAQAHDEDDTIAIPFTSGTTAKPKGVIYTHRGGYLAALGNVVESGLNMRDGEGRCGYLWTLPMFHAVGWSKRYPFIQCIRFMAAVMLIVATSLLRGIVLLEGPASNCFWASQSLT